MLIKHIVLTTYGSQGDLNPYLTLAGLLKKNGYKVTIATIKLYKEKVEAIGAEFIAIRPDIEEIDPDGNWAKKVNDPRHGGEFIIRELVVPYMEENYKALLTATEDCDLILSHVLTFFTPLVAEKRKIPWLSVMLQPSVMMSSYDPPAFAFAPNLPKLKFLGPGFFNLFFGLMKKVSDKWFNPVYELRKKEGFKESRVNLLMKYFSPHGSLALFPYSFAAPQKDWPENTYELGFPLYTDDDAVLSSEVQNFLKNGDPPVVFTLGSAVVEMESDFFKTAYEAVKLNGMRAIFLVGNNSGHINEYMSSDKSICIAKYEPYSLLFPGCSVIVHQCGIGTTSQALYSGRPQIMVPFAHDQPDNAQRVKRLGCGVIVYAKELNVKKLSNALIEISSEKSYAENAAGYRNELMKNNFEKNLIKAINSVLKS